MTSWLSLCRSRRARPDIFVCEFVAIRDVDGLLVDVRANVNGRVLDMLGQGGSARELAPLRSIEAEKLQKSLPVLIGGGMGAALQEVLKISTGPVAVVDREEELLAITGLMDRLSPAQAVRVYLLTERDSHKTMERLRQWQTDNGSLPLLPIALPFYMRLDRKFYGHIRDLLAANPENFWAKAISPRFQGKHPRVLLITSKYFLMGELVRACNELDLDFKLLTVPDEEVDRSEFVRELLTSSLSFKPDCCLTFNHMGVDREGVLMDLLSRLNLPLASWFVDNPHLIIHLYSSCVSPWAAIFTYDEDNVPSLKKAGFEHVRYLPLGTDPQRFNPRNRMLPVPSAWNARLSFVANSMLNKVESRLRKLSLPAALLRSFDAVATAFINSEIFSVADFLRKVFPDLWQEYLGLPDNEMKLGYETALTWRSTGIYRKECVLRLLPFHPLLVGDDGWKSELARCLPEPRYLDPISYYDELPRFYCHSEINFNCTSVQMKGAVNQRVFDIPASGAFVLSDWRSQMESLFEPDELAVFRHADEIPDLTEYYLRNERERRKFAERGRKRVLACHTWSRRLRELLDGMRAIFGTPALGQT